MKRTQKQAILAHLIKHGSIQPMEALRRYGIMRLASRISELKLEGHAIKVEIKTSRQGKRYAYYHVDWRRVR